METHLKEYVRFYHEVFGLKVDLASVELPPETKGFGWTVAIAKELGDKPLNTALAACEKLFPTGHYINEGNDDPDVENIFFNERSSKEGSYAIRVRNRIQADKENANLSADDIESRGIPTMTLLERVVLELFYFWKTGKHLDTRRISTLCSGSRKVWTQRRYGWSLSSTPQCVWANPMGLGGKEFIILACFCTSFTNDSLHARTVIA